MTIARPLATLDETTLFARARAAAAQTPSDLDTMLHCWGEAAQRHVALGKQMALRVLFDDLKVVRPERFADRTIQPPDWYLEAFTAARGLVRGNSAKGNRRVYVLLLRAPPGARPSEVGLYVGETYLSAEERLQQHVDGINASRAAKRCAIAVLPSFCPQLKLLTETHSKRLEAELAERLIEVMGRYRLSPARVQGGH
jgi:hypothetical protein